MSKVQEEDKKRKRQGQDEVELEETSEACVTRPRAPKRRKTTEFVPRQVNNTSVTAKSPLGTTSKARFLWTTKTKEAFFEALCKHGKDFEKICVFMNSKPHLKQIIPNLSRNQVRFFYYRTWKFVSRCYAAIKQGNSKQCNMAASTEVPTAAPVGGAIRSASTKEYLTDEEFFCDESQPPMNLAPMAAESIVGGVKDELENNTAEEEMFSDEGRVTPVTADIEKDEISDNSEHESEDDTEEEPSPLEGTAEEPEDQGATEEHEDPLPSVGGAGHSATQEESSGGNNVATMTGKVMVDGRMLPLDLVSLICYGKYRSKLQALGNKSEIGTKLYQLVYDGFTTIRYKGRRMQLKIPLCVALRDNRSTEQGQNGIMAGGIPDGTDHMILKLTAYNSDSWGHVQRLSFNPRLRIILPSNKTLSSMIKLLIERWNLPESEVNSVKIFYWLQASSCDDKERVGCCGHQIPCEQEDHTALELTYDGDTTLADIAMKLQVKNNLELMYDISGLVHKGCPSANRMGSLLRVVKVASKNERITPRVLSRISPRKYPFGSSLQRLTHRMAFGGRSRVKLDFSSPKKSEAATTVGTPTATRTTPLTSAVATPTNMEEMHTANQSPRVNIIVQQTSSEDTGNNQSSSSTSGINQSQKSGVKNINKKLKGNNRRTRIVTFDEHQLNQSGSFSSIPIKDLMILAQQQVNSFKSPKKSSTPSFSSPPQPSSPLQSFPQPRQKISTVTAVTIPNDVVSNVITPSSVVNSTTAGVSSLHQQDVGGAVYSISGSSSNPHLGLPVTVASATSNTTAAVVVNHVMTINPSVATTCAPVAVTTPAATNTHTTSVQQDSEVTPPPPVQIRPAKIIQQRPPRPITNQRNLVPQPLSFFNTSDKRTGVGGTAAGSQQSTQSGASVAEDTGKVLKAAESIKQQQQGAMGKTASSLNIQNLTVVQQIQLLALIQQYQTMQKPKPVATSQPSTTTQPPEDKTLTPDHQHSTNETLNKSSPSPVHGSETDELDTDLYKLMHAAPIRTTPKKLGQPSQPLPPDEVSSDTVNNLLTSLMNNQSSDKHQQDLARLANETAELLPSFTAGLFQGKSDTARAGTASVEPTGTLPELLLSNDTAQKPDHLPSLDSDSNPLGLFNFDNLLEDQDASLSAFLAYLESPKKKSASNNLPDLFSHDQDMSNIATNSNSSEEFSFQALLEENSQDLSNKFRELSNLLMQQNDAPMPFNT